MLDDIKLRLESYGYEFVEGDELLIELLEGKSIQYIKHFCNINEVPACLDHVLVDITCGEFLKLKHITGQLTSIQIESAVKSIQDGDTRVEYNVSYMDDNVGMFNKFLEALIHGHTDELLRHRKLVW